MKKFLLMMLALICAFSMVLGLVACASATSDSSASTSSVPTTDPSIPSTDAALAAEKESAKAQLDACAKADDYREAQQTLLATTITNGKSAIDTATDKAGVDAALTAAITAVKAIPTDAELTAAEELAAAEVLSAAKTAAKNTLDTYAKAEDYRNAQKSELSAAIADGKAAIDAASDKAGVEAALAAAKTKINDMPTDAELTTEEELAAAASLAEAKTIAKNALDAYVKAEDYRAAEQALLTTAIADGKSTIDAATDKTGVETALSAAKAAIDNIDTDAEITAKSPKITTTITNGMTFTSSQATLDVWVKDAAGAKLAASKVTVTVNGTAATMNWDDTEKTSYNFVFADGENTIVITAVDGAYTSSVTYTVTCDATAPTTITVAVEGFSVGLGYIVSPYKLVFDEDTLTEMADMYGYDDAAAMKENLTAAHSLDYALQAHGLTMSYQGGLASGNSFYMSSISGLDTSGIAVPDELLTALENNGYYPDSAVYEEGTLEEFDITYGSGWMYFINNNAPNVGFCDYIPQDGDVMRVQFTLAYGADIGSTMVGNTWFENVDRDELTVLIADALEAGVDIEEALEVVSTFGVSQDELDAACAALEANLDG